MFTKLSLSTFYFMITTIKRYLLGQGGGGGGGGGDSAPSGEEGGREGATCKCGQRGTESLYYINDCSFVATTSSKQYGFSNFHSLGTM